ncbi:MAG: LOG family protein [Bacteroidota bacterium]|nr:LOG family protein [Bacteroidota bacterium]
MNKKIITIFGSSKPLPGNSDYQTAYELGKLLAEAGFVICNGGYGGVMEASAHGAKDAGGKSIGIITEHFKRFANSNIDEVICVKTLIDRLLKLIELGDAYIVLKGSTGTLVELATVWEYMNKSVIKSKPIIIVGDFWSPVISTLKNELIHEGSEDVTKYVMTVGSPQECVELLINN